MSQIPKKGVSDQINGVRQVIHDLEFHLYLCWSPVTRKFLFVPGILESYVSPRFSQKTRIGYRPKPTTNRDRNKRNKFIRRENESNSK